MLYINNQDFVRELSKQRESWIGLQSNKEEPNVWFYEWKWVDGSRPTYMKDREIYITFSFQTRVIITNTLSKLKTKVQEN